MWLGRGIEIFRKLKDVQNFLASKPANTYWVAQKYIERPLLYNERKFDIRVWVLVTNKLDVYFCQQGYMRTSSDSYDLSATNNYVHLTNNCLQQHGNNYGRWEEGNTLPYEALKKWIKDKYPKIEFDFEKHILKRMKDLIIDTFLAWKKNLNPYNRKNCFELFGYDFLIDEDLRTWLIEVISLLKPRSDKIHSIRSTPILIWVYLTILLLDFYREWLITCLKSYWIHYFLQKNQGQGRIITYSS